MNLDVVAQMVAPVIDQADEPHNMRPGLEAALVDFEAPNAGLLRAAAMTLIAALARAAGALYRAFFIEINRRTPASSGRSELAIARCDGDEGVRGRGVSARTILDVAAPLPFGAFAVGRSHEAVAEATAPVCAAHRTASFLWGCSAGGADPGARSSAPTIAAVRQPFGEV
jgi:hypothetical protein